MLVVVALSITALFVIVALVIDLGVTRSDRRAGQRAVDNAAASAGQTFKDSNGDPVAACEDALGYLRVTLDADPFIGVAGATCASQFGATTCVDTTQRTLEAVSGNFRATLHYPVTDSSPLMARTSTIGNTGVALDAAVDGRGCERFGVQLTTTGDAFFGGVAGSDGRTSTVHAVSLVQASTDTSEVAALLLLERVGCGALQTSGGGDQGSGILVKAPGSTVPGIIASDSAGQTGPCTENNNADGWVIYGTALPAAGGGGPSITAQAASSTVPGIISVYAESIGGRSGYVAPRHDETNPGLNVNPSKGGINSRALADKRYNGPSTQISDLHARVNTLTASAPDGYVVLSGSQECKGNIPSSKLGATLIFADCATFEPDVNLFPAATSFLTRGNINIKSKKVLSLPVVEELLVRGCGDCTASVGNDAVTVGNGGALLLNTGDTDAIPDPVTGGTICGNRRAPGRTNVNTTAGTNTNTTTVATRGGRVSVGGFVRMCQTTLYIGDNATAYARQAVISAGVSPESYPAIARCSAAKPCPKNDAALLSSISFGGGGGSADWSAPDQLLTPPDGDDAALHPFEDLALWTETSTASDIKGLGLNSTSGVYFLPNAPFTFSGQGTQDQPLDAQFLTRRLNVSGQGSLVMMPDPANALEVQVFGNVALIR